ncbi:MAG: hypothetical protein HN548_13785 [Opitutae bacterium]|mgnify:CR=1 FL=1|jgi:hypothetical protein|nr:hypothetical protein [Opitutae bacterium]
MPNPLSFKIAHSLSLISVSMCLLAFNISANIDKTLVESTLLINLQEFPRSKIDKSNQNNRRLSNGASTSIQDAVDSNQTALSEITPLTISLQNTFSTFNDENLLEALEYAISYLALNKTNFNLTDSDILSGIKSSIIAYLKTSEANNENLESAVSKLPEIVYSSLIPARVKSWNGNVPVWSKDISRILMETINESELAADSALLQKTLAKNSVSTLLKILSESSDKANGFTNRISNVDISRSVPNEEMLFGGTPNFMKFDPEKTKFLEFAAKGLSDALFINNQSTFSKESIQSASKLIGSGTMEGAIEFISTLEGDNSLFAYEVTKALSTGLSLSAVYNTSNKEENRDLSLPESAAESISQEIAFSVISSSLDQGYGLELNRLAESVSFGAAMGAQLASVLDKSWDYEEGWELYSRNALAKATAKGSANGSINAASKYIENDPNIDDTNTKTTRREILDVASGSALGSLIGNTGLAVYYPTIMQPIINKSAQGATSGGITADNLSMVDKPKGVTEEFEIEIARALAHGAAHGALFQIVGLKKDAMPDKRTYDFETISAAEAVSYGSTYGAITGGIKSGEDGLIIKQAIYQGTSEGATVGASLALGYDESVADLVDLKSSIAVKAAIKKTNDEAAIKANSTMAVKTIQTSSQDMLLLMRKFNINPLYTNPTRIFSNPNAVEEEPLPFKDKFPVASPI